VVTTLLVAGSTLTFWIPWQTPFASTSSYSSVVIQSARLLVIRHYRARVSISVFHFHFHFHFHLLLFHMPPELLCNSTARCACRKVYCCCSALLCLWMHDSSSIIVLVIPHSQEGCQYPEYMERYFPTVWTLIFMVSSQLC